MERRIESEGSIFSGRIAVAVVVAYLHDCTPSDLNHVAQHGKENYRHENAARRGRLVTGQWGADYAGQMAETGASGCRSAESCLSAQVTLAEIALHFPACPVLTLALDHTQLLVYMLVTRGQGRHDLTYEGQASSSPCIHISDCSASTTRKRDDRDHISPYAVYRARMRLRLGEMFFSFFGAHPRLYSPR